MKLIKNNFQLGWIRPLPVLLDCPSVILSNKAALLSKESAFLGEQLDPILSFQKSNFLISHSFPLKYSFHIFCISVLWLTRHVLDYIKMRTLIVKTRNYILTVYFNDYLFTNQNFHKSRLFFLWFQFSEKGYIYVYKEKLRIINIFH